MLGPMNWLELTLDVRIRDSILKVGESLEKSDERRFWKKWKKNLFNFYFLIDFFTYFLFWFTESIQEILPTVDGLLSKSSLSEQKSGQTNPEHSSDWFLENRQSWVKNPMVL